MSANETTASAVLALGQAVWRAQTSLSTINEDPDTLEFSAGELTRELKSLGTECDLAYAILDEVVDKRHTTSATTQSVDGRLWDCLAMVVEEATSTLHELDLLVKIVGGEETRFIGQAQRLRKLDKSKESFAVTRTRTFRHIDELRLTLLLIDMLLMHTAYGLANQKLLDDIKKVQHLIQKLQRSSRLDPVSRLSYLELELVHHAQEILVQGTTIYEASVAGDSATSPRPPDRSSIVVKWVNSLDTIRQDQLYSSEKASRDAVDHIGDAQRKSTYQEELINTRNDDSDDDLDTDLMKAALETGTRSFDDKEWKDADALLNEAVRILQRLPPQQQLSCDVFDLHYKLAVCAYHTQDASNAEEALISLVQQQVSSDVQRGCIYNATHLLSQLYIRTSQLDRARAECERALHARRKLFGKQSDEALESLALMAHIYVLQDNRALAKSYLSMIPDHRRESILLIVEADLGPAVEHLDFSSLLTTPQLPNSSSQSGLAPKQIQDRGFSTPVGLGEGNQMYGPVSSTTNTPAGSPLLFGQSLASNDNSRPNTYYSTAGNASSAASIAESTSTTAQQEGRGKSASLSLRGRDQPRQKGPDTLYTPGSVAQRTPPSISSEHAQPSTLSRKQILEKVNCQPRDKLEEAVCASDFTALSALLSKKKSSFWRSTLRKRVRPERVTALHFAALFNEVSMACLLVDAGFNVNEVPFGYSTPLTPLHFAIGARRVEMVELLISSGARPVEKDTWGSMAAQLLSRAWLVKTLSESEREGTADRIIGVMSVLLKAGWDVNAPVDAKGKTILHQSVTFWSGQYKWDLQLRERVTAWLCEMGADPGKRDGEGRSACDMALQSEDKHLSSILDKAMHGQNGGDGLVELAG